MLMDDMLVSKGASCTACALQNIFEIDFHVDYGRDNWYKGTAGYTLEVGYNATE